MALARVVQVHVSYDNLFGAGVESRADVTLAEDTPLIYPALQQRVHVSVLCQCQPVVGCALYDVMRHVALQSDVKYVFKIIATRIYKKENIRQP